MAPTIQPYSRPKIKDPGLDPVIAMARDRHKKGLQVESQKRSVSGLSGGVLHKQLELAALEREIKIVEEGVQEYQDQIDLQKELKHDVEKAMANDVDWCQRYEALIGPFEVKYEECKAEVKVSFDYAKNKYLESLQKLIDDFGFHPCARHARRTAVPPEHACPTQLPAPAQHLSCARRISIPHAPPLVPPPFCRAFKRWFDEF